MRYSFLSVGGLLLAHPAVLAVAQSSACSTITNPLPTPSLAAGYEAQLVATNLTYPRSVQFDTAGNLLVLDRGVGVVRFSISQDCLLGENKMTVIADANINHGMTLSDDGLTLFVSDADNAYAYTYNATDGTVSGNTTLVTGMANADHITRTLLVSKTAPDMLLVSRGSNDNLDNATLVLSTGRSQIRAFNVTELSKASVDYSTNGVLFGWGLRNSVGLAEDGMGQIWSVENSADDLTRDGVDIHQDNPGEEMNYHGSIKDMSTRGNYGYPVCYAVWNASAIPNAGNLTTGEQFVLDPNSTFSDATCAEDYQPPRLAFQAHMAPLDIVFDSAGDAWVSFHGSWDKTNPSGYKISTVAFKDYEPTANNDSMSAAVDIVSNQNNTNCPGECFRPVGLAFDSAGRLFFASDSSGQIYVVKKTDNTGVASTSTAASGTSTPTGTSTGGAAAATTTKAAGVRNGISASFVLAMAIGVALLML